LARKRRSPKRPSEPRLSGVQPEEDAVGRKKRSYLLPRAVARVLMIRLRPTLAFRWPRLALEREFLRIEFVQ